jgi:hypothetical protein
MQLGHAPYQETNLQPIKKNKHILIICIPTGKFFLSMLFNHAANFYDYITSWTEVHGARPVAMPCCQPQIPH